MRLRDASCKNSGKRFQKIQQALADGRFLAESKSYQKRVHFSKWPSQNDDVPETLLIFQGSKLTVRWAGWLAGLAGWAGFGYRFIFAMCVHIYFAFAVYIQ